VLRPAQLHLICPLVCYQVCPAPVSGCASSGTLPPFSHLHRKTGPYDALHEQGLLALQLQAVCEDAVIPAPLHHLQPVLRCTSFPADAVGQHRGRRRRPEHCRLAEVLQVAGAQYGSLGVMRHDIERPGLRACDPLYPSKAAVHKAAAAPRHPEHKLLHLRGDMLRDGGRRHAPSEVHCRRLNTVTGKLARSLGVYTPAERMQHAACSVRTAGVYSPLPRARSRPTVFSWR